MGKVGKSKQAQIGKQVSFIEDVKSRWPLYVMVLPGVIYLFIFKYIPMMGSVIAFQNFSITKGIWESKWVGFDNFKAMFQYQDFWRILKNTLVLGFLKTVVIFPIPVLLSIMLNEMRRMGLKKGIQTIIYIPHFLSWVIVGGLIFDFFGASGIFNSIREMLGLKTLLVIQRESWFRPLYIISSIWKESGWGTVVYLAAISGIDPALYESASIDGASRFGKMRYITLPLLIPTVLTLFLLNIGSFLEAGFDQIYSILTPMTYSVGDVFSTYVYRAGILQAQYSTTTAIGLFQSVVGLILVVTFNKLSQKFSDDGGLW